MTSLFAAGKEVPPKFAMLVMAAIFVASPKMYHLDEVRNPITLGPDPPPVLDDLTSYGIPA